MILVSRRCHIAAQIFFPASSVKRQQAGLLVLQLKGEEQLFKMQLCLSGA